MDFVEKIPEKRIILDVPGYESDFATWNMYAEKFEFFCVALHLLSRSEEMNEQGIKWYWPYPITTYYELTEILKMNPCYVLLGPPLSFDLPNVKLKTKEIPLRMVCNVARPNYLADSSSSGIHGQFIRPEDVELYGEYIDVIEFGDIEGDMKKERTLLHIYKDNKEWPGNLNILISGLNQNVDNRIIPEDFGPCRMICGQKCMKTSLCHLCDSAILFAEGVRKFVEENQVNNP